MIAQQEGAYPVKLMCQTLGVWKSGYYAWKRRPLSQRAQVDEELVRRIRQVHQVSHQIYGSWRIQAELAEQGVVFSRKRVVRLMQGEGIQARRRRRHTVTTDSRHSDPVAPNLLDRDFRAPAPNTKWVTDITGVWTAEGWLYVAVVLDLFSRLVVGWAMAPIAMRNWSSKPCTWRWCSGIQRQDSCTTLTVEANIPVGGISPCLFRWGSRSA